MTKTKSQIGRMSKRKGNRFERNLAKIFSNWAGEPFRKVPTSGAFPKQGELGVAARTVLAGDLIAPPWFPFSVEAKNHKDYRLDDMLLEPGKYKIQEWWKQCCDDAESCGLKPLLVIKRARRPIFCIFKPFFQMDFPKTYIRFHISNESLYLFNLEDFLGLFSPNHFKTLIVRKEQNET